MDYREGLSAELPAPRDDEPGGLRDDILDELTDHLACAFRRELLRGADTATARQRVLERFGDPAALAGRLWFDAMKGKIMSQRILVVYCIVLTVISLSLAFMMWNQAVHAQRLAAIAQAEMAEQMHRAQEVQQQTVAALQAMSKAASSTKSPFWIPVTFKLTQETPDGPPLVGLHVSLGRGNKGALKEGAIQRESDDKGMLDFGVVQPGDWEFACFNGTWRMTGTLNVLPGTTIANSIVCPRFSERYVPITVHAAWPPDLAERGLAIVASFQHEGFTYQPPMHWQLLDNSPVGWIYVFCGPGPNTMTRIAGRGPTFWRLTTPASAPFVRNASDLPDVKPLKRNQIYLDLLENDGAGDTKAVESLPGNYRLQKLAVILPRKDLATGSHGERCELVALVSTVGGFGQQVIELGRPPGEPVNSADRAISINNFQGVSVPSLFGRDAIATFEAKKGQPNLWTVRLPDELTQAVREKLKAVTKK